VNSSPSLRAGSMAKKPTSACSLRTASRPAGATANTRSGGTGGAKAVAGSRHDATGTGPARRRATASCGGAAGQAAGYAVEEEAEPEAELLVGRVEPGMTGGIRGTRQPASAAAAAGGEQLQGG